MDEARGAHESRGKRDALDELWDELEAGLTTFLGLMTDPGEGDHLLLELPDPDPEGDGCPPYAQFAAFDAGTMIRAEISGNAYLRAHYALDEAGCAFLRDAGWEGNENQGDADGERNWFVDTSTRDTGDVAHQVICVLRSHFGIAHPQLLTYSAWGPAADEAYLLGVCASADVPVDEPQAPKTVEKIGPRPERGHRLVFSANRDELFEAVTQALADSYGEEPVIDDDGDFVLDHMDQAVWVRVRHDIPTIEIMARVAHDVRSRRTTAVEIGLLNRDHPWVRWTLRDRTIWQQVAVPGLPFVQQHLEDLIEVFCRAMMMTRDDLVLRTRAKVG